jgi:hypothetical protein
VSSHPLNSHELQTIQAENFIPNIIEMFSRKKVEIDSVIDKMSPAITLSTKIMLHLKNKFSRRVNKKK